MEAFDIIEVCIFINFLQDIKIKWKLLKVCGMPQILQEINCIELCHISQMRISQAQIDI